MPNAGNIVTWGQFAIVLAVTITVLGAGAAKLHSDMSKLTSEVDELSKQVSGLREGVALANGRLAILIQEAQRRRQP